MPTTAQQIAELKEAVTRLEGAVGDPTRKYLRGDTPPAELPNGEYPVLYRQKMLNYAIDDLSKRVYEMPAPAPVVVVDPDPSPAPTPSLEGLSVEQLRALALALAPYLPASIVGNPTVIAEPNGSIAFRNNMERAVMQGGSTDERTGNQRLNQWDAGFRTEQNYQHSGSRKLPYSIFGGNSRGVWEYNWFPAAEGDQGDGDVGDSGVQMNPNHPLFPVYRGQGFFIDQGNYHVMSYDGSEALSRRRHLMMGTQRAGWPLAIVVSPQRVGDRPQNRTVIWSDADGGPNPLMVVIDGKLRRLESYDVEGGRKGLCYTP